MQAPANEHLETVFQTGSWETRVERVIQVERLALKDAIPIIRDNDDNIVRDGEVVFPPYECIRKKTCEGNHAGKCVQLCYTSREFCFGCGIEKMKRVRNLHSYISNAIIKDNETVGSIDNGAHRASHAKYEANPGVLKPTSSAEFGRLVNIVGYCKNPQCRRRAVRAVAAGDHCRYHCNVCLATELDKTYTDAELSTCAVLFMPKGDHANWLGKPIVQDRISVELRFDDGRCTAAQSSVEGYWLRIAPRDRERESEIFWRLPWVFVVTSPCYYKAKGREAPMFLGLYRGHIKGRYVCHNIAIGQKCDSLDSNKVREFLTAFPSLIVPPHYPMWMETGPSTNYPGSLVVQHECGLCTRKTSASSGVPDLREIVQRLHIDAMREPEYSRASPERRKKILAAKIQGSMTDVTQVSEVEAEIKVVEKPDASV